MYSNSMFSLYLGMNGNQGLKLCLADMCKNLLLVVYVVILCFQQSVVSATILGAFRQCRSVRESSFGLSSVVLNLLLQFAGKSNVTKAILNSKICILDLNFITRH